MSKQKVWFGKRFSSEGTVYTRFVSMTQAEAIDAVKKVRGSNLSSMNENDQIHAKRDIKVEGKYIYLNLTQALYMCNSNGYNTAIYLTDRERCKDDTPFVLNMYYRNNEIYELK